MGKRVDGAERWCANARKYRDQAAEALEPGTRDALLALAALCDDIVLTLRGRIVAADPFISARTAQRGGPKHGRAIASQH